MVMDVDIVLDYRIVLVVNVDVVCMAWIGVIRLIVFSWRAVGGTVAAGGGWPRERRKKLIWNVRKFNHKSESRCICTWSKP